MKGPMVAPDTARPTDPEGVATWLADAGVSSVALPFVDSAGITRVKSIPLSRFSTVAGTGVGLSVLFNVAMTNDEFALLDGYIDGPSGDLRLRPDPVATVPLAALPGWAWAPVDQYTQQGEPFPACPRTFARAAAARFEGHGLSIRATFEVEFSMGLRDEDGEFHPAHTGPGYSDIALVANHEFAHELMSTFEAQGLGLQQFHPEYADGQFELSIAPVDPVAAADATMVARQTIRAVAKRHGWITSFAPRVASDTGNGTHLHLSVWQGSRNLMSGGSGPYGMEPAAEAFIAGILASLPAITAVTAPTCASYLRLQPKHWSGATRCWGLENREAALRFIAGATPSTAGAANVEFKPADGTANPYLTMGAILSAGLDGIEKDLRLPPPTEEDPTSLPTEVARARGIEQLPSSLAEAAERFAASDVLRAAMGDFLFETFLATRRGEAERYGSMSDQELIRRTRWRF
jgi:glutamine synthetase